MEPSEGGGRLIRAFIGIPVPAETAKTLASLQFSCPIGKSVRPENLHLTLAFLDDQPEHVLRELHEDLATISISSFDIRLRGLEVLGGRWPGTVVISADGGDALVDLFRYISNTVRSVGISLPRRRFRPHVTLIRTNRDPDPLGQTKLNDFLGAVYAGPFEFRARKFTLVQSRLAPTGAVYDAMAEYPMF